MPDAELTGLSAEGSAPAEPVVIPTLPAGQVTHTVTETHTPPTTATPFFPRDQALWLPAGSVSAILALIVIVAYVVFSFKAGWSPPPELGSMAQLAFGVYVGQKMSKP